MSVKTTRMMVIVEHDDKISARDVEHIARYALENTLAAVYGDVDRVRITHITDEDGE